MPDINQTGFIVSLSVAILSWIFAMNSLAGVLMFAYDVRECQSTVAQGFNQSCSAVIVEYDFCLFALIVCGVTGIISTVVHLAGKR
jgi:cell division protein FtsX